MLTAMYEQWKRVTFVARLFFKGLGLALASKMCPDQSQAFKEVNNSQAFTVGRKIFHPFCFLNELLPGAPRRISTKSSASIRRTECVGLIFSHTPKSNIHWNQVITMRSRDFCTFNALQSKCPRRFWEMDPEVLHACLMCPCQALYECFFFLPRWKRGIP